MAIEDLRNDEFANYQDILESNRQYPHDLQRQFFNLKKMQDLQYEMTAREITHDFK